jgi:zinc protease
MGAVLLAAALAASPAASPWSGLAVEVIDNGLTVMTYEDHTAPVVTICVAVRTGATCETPETNGLAHFYEHMFFKGNEAVPDQAAYSERMRELGIVRNGVTSSESVRYYFTLPSDRLEEGLEFMYSAIATPLFDPGEMEREREVILNEYQRNTAHPYWDMWKAREQVLFSDCPWRANTIGTPDVIMSASPEVMRRFQEMYYTPDNCALIVAGDAPAERVERLAEDVFGAWEPAGVSHYDSLEVCIGLERDTTVSISGPEGISYVSVVYPGPPIQEDPEATYSADVWGTYLGRRSGDFYRRLVTEGPFLDASGSYYTQRYGPTVSFGGPVEPGREDEAVRLLRSEIDSLCTPGYYAPDGLDTARGIMRRERLLKAEVARDIAVETLSFWWVVAGGVDYFRNYLDNIARVDREDVMEFLDGYVCTSPSATFVLRGSEREG